MDFRLKFLLFLLLFQLLLNKLQSWAIFLLNTKKFNELLFENEKKLPRRESVLQVRPVYNCISKHLQQADIFLDKTKKIMHKEQLEVEIMNSRINCITDLLNSGDQSERRRKMSPGESPFIDDHIVYKKKQAKNSSF